MLRDGSALTWARLWFWSAASLALTSFCPRAWRIVTGGSGGAAVIVFGLIVFVLYLAAAMMAARRLPGAWADDAQVELYGVAGIGLVLVYFALELR